MTTPFWCLLVVAAIPYVLAGVGGYLKVKQLGRFDSHHPRIQNAALEGAAARTWAAQLNAWEALALFASAVFVAHLAGANPATSATASILFVAARVLHPVFYIGDKPPLRTGVFLVGLGSCFWLFMLAIAA